MSPLVKPVKVDEKAVEWRIFSVPVRIHLDRLWKRVQLASWILSRSQVTERRLGFAGGAGADLRAGGLQHGGLYPQPMGADILHGGAERAHRRRWGTPCAATGTPHPLFPSCAMLLKPISQRPEIIAVVLRRLSTRSGRLPWRRFRMRCWLTVYRCLRCAASPPRPPRCSSALLSSAAIFLSS